MSMSATYSPEDNKLRLYSVGRLDKETYARVSAAGFRYAPKQGLFVAPMWTPSRADLLVELCGEIGDEDTSLVDRAEERADRFEGYQESRAQDAEAARRGVDAVAQRFEFGQPILVGHHSERKARKDAERIENGMRKAVQMWDTAQYWKQRAAGALAHAKYKELPEVRARRIKTIEADKRKQERTIAEAEKRLQAWQVDGLTLPEALHIANSSHYSQCFPLADFPRDPPASQYEGQMGLWSALDGGVITVEQARAIALRIYPNTIAWARRWVEHYDNRLAYERAMLDEQGGLVADRFDIQIGGTVLVRGQWLVVTRVNKAGGRISSVSTNSRFVRVKSIEEVDDYRAPDAEQAAKVQAATKLPPLANYEGEGFAHITQAQWDAIPKDYRTTKKIEATDKAGRHRVRCALGVYVLGDEKDFNKRHGWPFVFITDAKPVRPPAAAEAAPKPEPLPAPVPARSEPRPVYQAPAPTDFDRMRAQLREGVKVVSAPQLFPTPADLAARMVDLAGLCDGDRILEPSAGTGRIVQALRDTGKTMHIVAVEVNRDLSDVLYRSYQAKPTEIPQEVEVITADFLAVKSVGVFDAIVMNPPFENGADVKHITHALTMLKPGGRLVALCANGPRQNAVLRPLVEARGGEWEDLPADTFKAEGTGVRTALIAVGAG